MDSRSSDLCRPVCVRVFRLIRGVGVEALIALAVQLINCAKHASNDEPTAESAADPALQVHSFVTGEKGGTREDGQQHHRNTKRGLFAFRSFIPLVTT